MEVGLLIIRLAIGLTIAAHGAQKLVGAFGGSGLAATADYLESLGFRPGRRHAETAAATETAAGLLVAVGLLTPFAAAGIIGVMVVAALAAHARRPFWLASGGYEYPFVLGVVATGLAFTGPGFVSIDRLLGLDLAGAVWGSLALVLGIGSGAAYLATRGAEEAEVIDVRDSADADGTIAAPSQSAAG